MDNATMCEFENWGWNGLLAHSKQFMNFQDVFEMKYARMPDEPLGGGGDSPGGASFTGSIGETSTGKPTLEDRISDTSASGSSSDSEDSEAEREKRLKELQEQVSVRTFPPL